MSTSFKGLTITVGADTKQFNKEMKAVDRSIRETNKQVNELQKGLELEFDAGRFTEAQRLAQKAIQDTENKAKALRDQLKFMEESGADTQSAQYQKLQTELLKTENQAVLLKNKLDQIKDLKIQNLAKQFEDVGKGITKAGQALAPFSAAAAGALTGLAAIGKSTINSADTLKTLADRVNLSAEELQKWQYIAMQTDVTNEELQAGLVKTQGAFGSLAKGDVDVASKALTALGFTAEQASKGMAANFDDLVKRLSSIEDPVLQAAYANEIFGERMGSKLIPMLKAGGDGLAQLSQEFESFNTLTNEQIDSLAEFDNVMNNINYSLKTIKDQVGAALLPVMQSLADFLNSKVIPAVRSLAEWFTGLTDSQKNMLVGTLAFVAALAPALIIIGKLTTGIGGVVKAVGGLNTALSFLAAHPVIAIIGTIAALIGVLYTANEQFRESINGLIGTLGSALMPILNIIGELFNQLLGAVMPLIDAIGNVLAPIIQMLVSILNPLIGIVENMLVPAMAKLQLAFNLIHVILGPTIAWLQTLAEVFTWVAKKIQEASNWLIDHVFNPLLQHIENFVNGGIDMLNGLIEAINSMGGWLGISLDKLNHVKLQIDTGVKTPEPEVESRVPEVPRVEDALTTTPGTNVPNYITNNDYSNKDINIQVVVENYAENVDVDDMVRQINLKLAESL